MLPIVVASAPAVGGGPIVKRAFEHGVRGRGNRVVRVVQPTSERVPEREYQRATKGSNVRLWYLPASEPCNFLPEFVVVAAAAVGAVVVVGGGGAGGSCGGVVFWVLGQFRQSIVVFRRSNGTHEV